MSEWTESPASFHDPALAQEVVEFMAPSGDGIYLDGTVGGGGHTAALLKECSSCRILAVDRDPDALKEAKAALAKAPNNADAWNLMGYAHRKLGQVDQALGFYQKALSLNAEHRGALEYLGELYLQTGRPK